jgi:hypothetical protein
MSKMHMQIEDLILPAPLQFQDIKRISLSQNDYAASSDGLPRLDRGFNIKGDSGGEYQVITLAQFRRALFNKSYGVTLGNPPRVSESERNDLLQAISADEGKVTIQLAANQWCDTPLVFVEKTGAIDTTIDIGII